MDIQVTGPKIYFEIPILGGIRITQTTVSLLVVTILLITLSYFLTRKLTKRPGKAQVIVEKLISMLYGLVEDTMGKHNLVFAPYIGTIFLSSIMGTLIGMTQIFRSTTADLSVTLAWALVTSVMVWYHNIKNFGFKAWLNANPEKLTNNGGNDIVAAVSALGFDGYMTAVEAIKAADSADSQAVADALGGVVYTGVTGEIKFDEIGDAVRNLAYIKTVDTVNGAFVFGKIQTIAD